MKNFTNNFKQFTSRLSARWLIMALMLLLGTSSAWAWGWVVRCVDLQSSENPTYYLGDEATFYWCFNGDGSNATFKRACISTSSSSAGTWMDNLKWVKDGCDGNDNKTWKASFLLSSTGTKYYGLWLGWGNSVGDNGRYYNGSSSWGEGSTNFSSSKFTVNELPNPTDQTNSLSGTTATLSWKKNSTYTTVLVVRYVKGATETKPIGGISYSANNTIGNGTVVYKGTAGSCTNTITAGNSYDYYFYTVNNNYYSSGVKTTLEGCTTPNFSVQLSNATVTKGDENITASIKVTGTPSPAVAWSSSDEEVATIDANGNITAYKGGETTITATTTGDGGFCENVQQPATLTVKENPTVTISADNNPICSGEEATLTANISNLSEGINPTVSWYKKGENGVKETGTTYKPTTSGEYYVIVTGDYINEVSLEEKPLQFTINQTPTLESTLENKATEVEICGSGNAALSVTPGFVSYSWGDGNTKTVNATGKYKVTATDANGCTSNEVEFDVKVLNPTVTLVGDKEQIVCPGANANFEVVLTNGQSVSWKDADGTEISTSNPFTPQIEGEAGTTYTYKVVVSEGSCSSEESTVSATIPTIDLTVGSISGDNEICSGNATTLTLTGMVNGTVEKWLKSTDNNNYSDVSNTTTTLNTGNLTTSTYYKALVSSSVCPNHKEPTEAYLVIVNPLPAITGISVNNSTPVINEDVLLTVEGSDIARVEWSITSGNNASLSDASGNSVKLTSTTSGTVTVTATATSGAGCTATSTKDVTFKAVENCDPITDNTKIEIWCQVTGTTTPYCHAYNIKSPNNVGFADWPGLTHTSKNGDYYIWTLDKTNGLDIDNNKVGIVFSKNSSGNNQTADITAFYVGNRYYFTYNAGSDKKDTNYTKGNSEPLTTYPPLSAPAVKTVSATSEEGSGIVTFTGKIIKTGCADNSKIYYGYQYRLETEDWPTTGVEASNTPVNGKLIPCTNASATALNYQFSTDVEGLDDGDYHFRAYIINGYNFTNGNYDQGVYYGLEKLVTVSTVKTPISNVTLDYCDENGENVGTNPNPMCKGTTAYIKLNYDGTRYSEYKWLINGNETNKIEKIAENVWAFEIQQEEELVTVELRNDANKDGETPTWATSNKLTFTMVAVPTTPTVSLSPNVICSSNLDGATLSIASVAVGQTYVLYKYADENDNEGAEVDGYDALTCSDAKDELSFTNLTQAGRYFVKTYNTDNCQSIMSASSFATLEVVDAGDVFISFEPTSAETTPWMPAKFTVSASDAYTLNVTKGNPAEAATEAEVSQNGNNVSVKIPLPQGSTLPEGTTNVYGQYENVVFPGGATTQYTITATLSATGGDDNPCATPASATITLTPYVEECTIGH